MNSRNLPSGAQSYNWTELHLYWLSGILRGQGRGGLGGKGYLLVLGEVGKKAMGEKDFMWRKRTI